MQRRPFLTTLARTVALAGGLSLAWAAYAVDITFKPVAPGVYAYVGDIEGRTYDNEALNANGQAVLAAPASYFHSNMISTGAGAGANHFDDLLSHPSISQLMARAQLAPRTQP